MAPSSALTYLSNPLANSAQLQRFQHSNPNAEAVCFSLLKFTQATGILLRLPQEVIATAIVLLQRSWLSGEDVHLDLEAEDSVFSCAAAVFLSAKLSFTPVSPRSVINVTAYLRATITASTTTTAAAAAFFGATSPPPEAASFHVTEGGYARLKLELFALETTLLTRLAFDTHVSLPHALALTYVQALGVSTPPLARRVLAHLNAALLSPQLLYVTHGPQALAVAAIYLAAREDGVNDDDEEVPGGGGGAVKLVDGNWWEVFDVDREDLGFLVLAYGSLANFARAEREAAGVDSAE